MRKSLLGIMCFLAILLVGFQVAGQYGRAYTIEATVDIKPDTINLNRKGRWITAYITLPEGYNVSDFDRSTILLEGIFRPEWSNIEDGKLMAKFDSAPVIDYLWDRLYHMGGSRGYLELTVRGQLTNGVDFVGSDTVAIMDPPPDQ